VVDDEKDFLSTLSERLRHKNFEVTATTQGETAIKAVKKALAEVPEDNVVLLLIQEGTYARYVALKTD
jgi:DNA-binding response OmpR family regulator